MNKTMMITLLILLSACEYTTKEDFKKTFDECYANIPKIAETSKFKPLVDPHLIEKCYDTAMELHSVPVNKGVYQK